MGARTRLRAVTKRGDAWGGSRGSCNYSWKRSSEASEGSLLLPRMVETEKIAWERVVSSASTEVGVSESRRCPILQCAQRCANLSVSGSARGGLGQSRLKRVGKAEASGSRRWDWWSPQYSRTPVNSSQYRRPLLCAPGSELLASDDDPSEVVLAVPLRPQAGTGGGGALERARWYARSLAEGESHSDAGKPREGGAAEDTGTVSWGWRAAG